MQHRHSCHLLPNNVNLDSTACGFIIFSRLCILLSGKAQSMLGDVVHNSQFWATGGFMTCDDQLQLCNMQAGSVPAGLFLITRLCSDDHFKLPKVSWLFWPFGLQGKFRKKKKKAAFAEPRPQLLIPVRQLFPIFLLWSQMSPQSHVNQNRELKN